MVYSTKRFVLILPGGILFLCFLSPLRIAITSLREERAYLSAFRTFVRFAPIWFCLFPHPLSVWEGLWLVIVIPGLFSYFFSNNLFWQVVVDYNYNKETYHDAVL